jgi:hypothetical protein
MALYYLMSQLPSLDGISENMPLPITEERFLELCSNSLGKKAMEELKKLSLLPSKIPENSSSDLINSWNDGERNLRLCLAKIRADKMNKPSDVENKSFLIPLIQAAGTAAQMESPMEAEKFLNNYRLSFLESLRPLDNFTEDSLYYYWLKLKLLLRIRNFDKDSGEAAYRNIYNSIISGDSVEAIQ